MDFFSFEKLYAYQHARLLVVEVYKIIESLPTNERFALCQQIQRSITSVTSNIAEGCGRISLKEKIHFLEVAYGSLFESYCQIQTCVDLRYVPEETFNNLKPSFFNVSRLINALRQSYVEGLSQSAKSQSN